MAEEKKLSDYPQAVNEQYERTLDAIALFDIKAGITVLTGKNGTGKSLLRKQMGFHLQEEKWKLSTVSMQTRTGDNFSFGAMSGVGKDLDWVPTSMWTLGLLEGMLNDAAKSKEPRYVVIDEPEIGMGEETVMALAAWLNEKLQSLPPCIKGVLVITHSRYMVQHLKHDKFVNLDGYETGEAWLSRELVPTDLAALQQNDLFKVVKLQERETRAEIDAEEAAKKTEKK